MYDRINARVCPQYLHCHPVTAWSTSCHFGISKPSFLRTRSQPSGITYIPSSVRVRQRDENRALEIASSFAELAILCPAHLVAVINAFPEDICGTRNPLLLSVWTSSENSRAFYDARRSVGSPWQSTKLPLGLFTNMTALRKDLHMGLPILSQSKSSLDTRGNQTCMPLQVTETSLSKSTQP